MFPLYYMHSDAYLSLQLHGGVSLHLMRGRFFISQAGNVNISGFLQFPSDRYRVLSRVNNNLKPTTTILTVVRQYGRHNN